MPAKATMVCPILTNGPPLTGLVAVLMMTITPAMTRLGGNQIHSNLKAVLLEIVVIPAR